MAWITDTEQKNGAKFGTDLVNIPHRMGESGLFTDEALAELIDSYPREYYMLTTMTPQGERQVWRNGDKGNLSGAEVLQAIKEGQLWLCLRRFDIVAPMYHQMVQDAFGELEASNPGLKTFKHESSLLISSPGARVFYHMDIPMIALWHLRGRKRVWVYDADNKTHLPDTSVEGIVLRETEEEIAYDPEWDKEAVAIDLEPGQVVSWPLNAPHRVDNLDGLNVSITTEFFTPAARRKYGVYYANGFARRHLGYTPKSAAYEGPMAYAKSAAALAIKKLGLAKASERAMMCSFKLEKSRFGQIIDLAPQERWNIQQA
jgi:hypothetical protein